MKKNVIKALWLEGGEIVELIIENEADVREYALLDASRLIQRGGRWDMERVGTDDEMMDPIELGRTMRLGRPRPTFASVFTDGPDAQHKPDERWAAIHSRFPFERSVRTVDPLRSVAAVVSPPAMQPFLVYAMVLPAAHLSWYDAPAAGGQAFVAALGNLVMDVGNIRAAHPDLDLFVAGDFNQDLAEDHHYGSAFKKRALRDALGEANLIALTAGPNDPVRAASAPWACIDHICVSSAAWRVRRSVRWPNLPEPDTKLSDHFGVALEVVRG